MKPLVEAIENSGMTYDELSAKSGVNKTQISRFVHGFARMRIDLAEKLAEVLGLELKKVKGEEKTK
jgi:ribosome-binding protein aMBF1 (putative translation factor)